MVQEISLIGGKCLAMTFDNKESIEQVELYRKGLLDLAGYAAMMIEQNPNIEPEGVGWGIMYAIKIARMLEGEVRGKK